MTYFIENQQKHPKVGVVANLGPMLWKKAKKLALSITKFISDNKKNTKDYDKSENIYYRITKVIKNYTFCQSNQ